MPKRKSDEWPAGEYVLLANTYQETVFNDKGDIVDYVDYERGEKLELDERNAFRLGEVGAVAKPDSVQAKMATGELSEVALDLSQDEGALEAQLEAIKARLDELKSVEDEREELKEAQGPHINVQSMKLQPRSEVKEAQEADNKASEKASAKKSNK